MRLVIFDIDDTAWGLNNKICSMFGIDINSIESFYIKNNSKLSEYQKEQLLSKYSDPEIFKNIEWYDGFTEIFDLEQLDCEVLINSNCNSQDIKNAKHYELVDKLGFNDDKVILNVIDDPKNKSMHSDVFILVDDSPFNLAKSTAMYNIALRKPWNTSEQGAEIIGDKKVIFCDTFRDVLSTVTKILNGVGDYNEYKN